MVWRLVVEVRQLEMWKRWSWNQARESQTGQSVEDLTEVEVRPEQSIEVRALVEAESQAHHQDNLVLGVEGNLPGDNCSVVWALH